MSQLLLRAAPGLKVPMDGQPHRYITDAETVSVPESAYYLRCIDYGDLVRINPAPADPESKPKGAK